MTQKINCKCGLKLFEKDIVEDDGKIVPIEHPNGGPACGFQVASTYTYRCPKCFTLNKVKA